MISARRSATQPVAAEGREEVPEGGAVMTRVTVGLSTCGIAAGAEDTFAALGKTLADLPDAPELLRTGCVGMCYQEPLVEISDGDGVRYLYGHVSPDKVARLVEEHIGKGEPVADWLVWTSGRRDIAYLSRQHRIVLRNCGNIDPESIDDYIQDGRLPRLQKVLEAKDPDGLVNTMISGLRGRRRRFPGIVGLPKGQGRRSTSSATPTRATRARSWTARSSRATRTRSSRG
jgi:NADH-quinone oxidoreductase subunit F